jgi:formate hydrogenlyase transcriptional activator
MNSFETIASRYEALLGIFDMLQEHQHLEELVRGLPENLRRVVDFRHLSVMLMRPRTNKPYWYLAPHCDPSALVLTLDLPVEHEWLSWAYQHQQAAIIPDQAFEHCREWLRDRELELGYAVPLTVADRRIGAMFLGRTCETGVPAEEVRFLSTVAGRIALAAEHLLLWNDTATGRENAALRDEVASTSMFEEIVGSSESLYFVLSQVAKVAPENATVLITGESGTGKELIARAIHKRSRRSKEPFIRVNSAAIPPSLIAAELFGYEKGAFTGANQRHIGRFESANRGTIFLDEVGDMPMEAQIALLRVLQEHEIERVGGFRSIPVDVRVLAATNRDLSAEVDAGRFRLDLFYRLNVFPIEVPALRDRRDDILVLAKYFVERFAAASGRKARNIDGRTLELLQIYDWPGNIRELQNVLQRAVILCEGGTISVEEAWLRRGDGGKRRAPVALDSFLIKQEKELIEATLEKTRGRIAGPEGAADKLGVPRSTLESKIRNLSIDKHRFRVAVGGRAV